MYNWSPCICIMMLLYSNGSRPQSSADWYIASLYYYYYYYYGIFFDLGLGCPGLIFNTHSNKVKKIKATCQSPLYILVLTICEFQGDQLYIAVLFWYLVKRDLSNVCYCALSVASTSMKRHFVPHCMAMFIWSGCICKKCG